MPGAADLPVVVIGCGMSGVLTAIRLREAGFPFVVIEKNEGPGGTWWENTYPGARVDVGNHFYCYSFRPNDFLTPLRVTGRDGRDLHRSEANAPAPTSASPSPGFRTSFCSTVPAPISPAVAASSSPPSARCA